MSKRIEKEPDGYIRDLMRKRRNEIKGIIGLNAFLLAFPVIMMSLLLIQAFKPIPNELTTETHIFQDYIKAKSGGRRRHGHPAYFVSESGEYFAIKFADAADFIEGKSYEISYKVGLFHTWAYIISDGNDEIISIDDWTHYRNENISHLPTDALIFFSIYLLIATPVNILVYKINIKNVSQINQKIEKRRIKRSKKK